MEDTGTSCKIQGVELGFEIISEEHDESKMKKSRKSVHMIQFMPGSYMFCVCSSIGDLIFSDSASAEGLSSSLSSDGRIRSCSCNYVDKSSNKIHSGVMKKSSTCSTKTTSTASTAMVMPTESEIEEFFLETEHLQSKRFTEKYNYDIVKDEPLAGRYEWIAMKHR